MPSSNNEQSGDDKIQNRVGMPAHRVGYGNSPAVIVVDLQTGLTRSEYSLGADLSDVIEQTNELTAVADETDVPVMYTRHVPYPEHERIGIWRKIDDIETLDPERESGRLDNRLDIRNSSYVIDKSQASGFYETPLSSMLTDWGIDTTIVVGCSTSGCIRATTLTPAPVAIE